MKVELDGSSLHSSLRSALRTAGTSLLGALAFLYVSLRRLVATTRSLGGTATRWFASRGVSSRRRVESVLTAERTRRATRRAWRGLVGRRLDVSAAAALLAPLLALGTELWVVDTYGYRRIEQWVLGTWTGADPRMIVFLGVALLVALAAAFAAGNSGLLPSIVLVMGPIFGVGFARYGLTFEYYGTVGIPNATGVALVLAVAYGVPIGTAGFVIGSVARLIVDRLGRNRGREPAPENV